MLANHVLPEFKSANGYLRAKACIVCSEYAQVVAKYDHSGARVTIES